MNVNIGKALTTDPWFTNYAPSKTFDLNTTEQLYTYTFTVTEATEANSKIVFEVGNIVSGSAITAIYIDDISIQEAVTATVPASVILTNTNSLVANGDISVDTTGWNTWWGDEWAGYSSGTIAAEGGKLKIHLDFVGGAAYSPQVFQENITLENGKTYMVSFKAKAGVARKMNVNIGKPLTVAPYFTNYAATKMIDLTTTEQQYTYIFTVTEATESAIKLVFEVGNIADGGAVTDIYLDDISIREVIIA